MITIDLFTSFDFSGHGIYENFPAISGTWNFCETDLLFLTIQRICKSYSRNMQFWHHFPFDCDDESNPFPLFFWIGRNQEDYKWPAWPGQVW